MITRVVKFYPQFGRNIILVIWKSTSEFQDTASKFYGFPTKNVLAIPSPLDIILIVLDRAMSFNGPKVFVYFRLSFRLYFDG